MSQITFANKVTLVNQPDVANENKVTASDMNEIKTAHNDTDNNVNNLINGEIYSTSEIKTNKIWIDGKPIYRKVLSGTLPIGSGDNAFSISDSEIVSVNGFVKSKYNQWWSINTYFSSTSSDYNINCRLNSSRNEIVLYCGSFYDTGSQYFMVVEYTKNS